VSFLAILGDGDPALSDQVGHVLPGGGGGVVPEGYCSAGSVARTNPYRGISEPDPRPDPDPEAIRVLC
jgi:hypothetical protein